MNWHQNNALACFSYDWTWAALWWHGWCSCRPVNPSPLQSCQVGKPYDVTWHQNKASFIFYLFIYLFFFFFFFVVVVVVVLFCFFVCLLLVFFFFFFLFFFFIGISFSNHLYNALAETKSYINLSQITSGIVFCFFNYTLLDPEFWASSWNLRVSSWKFRVSS